MPLHKSTVPGKVIALVHGKSGKLTRAWQTVQVLSNVLQCRLDIDLFIYALRLPKSCAAPAGLLCRDARMQHCKKGRLWSIHESQYTCSLQ